MPTKFEIANEILSELGYRTKESYEGFSTRLELDILRELKNLNTDTLMDLKINSRKRVQKITVPEGITEIKNPINGEISEEDGGIIDLSTKRKYIFNPNHQDFYLNRAADNQYSIFDNKMLFKSKSSNRILNIYYYTFDTAKSSNGVDKCYLDDATDISLIPENLQLKILVNGVCYQLKKRSTNTRVPFWMNEYIDGRRQLKAYTLSEDQDLTFEIDKFKSTFMRRVV